MNKKALFRLLSKLLPTASTASAINLYTKYDRFQLVGIFVQGFC